MSGLRCFLCLTFSLFVAFAAQPQPAPGNHSLRPIEPPIPKAAAIEPIALTSPAPLPRSGAVVGSLSSDTDTNNGFVILGGEQRDSWSYNANTTYWTKLSTILYVHVSCSVQDGDSIYIYGRNGSSSRLYLYTIGEDTIQDLDVNGSAPLQGVQCAKMGTILYLFGGGCTSDIYQHDLSGSDKHWTLVKPATKEVPPGTKGAGGVVLGKEFVMWGGGCRTNNSVWRFNFDTKTWSADEPKSTVAPQLRAYHSAVVDPLSEFPSFIIFGGWSSGAVLGDIWVYQNMTWEEIIPRNWSHNPAPRYSANTVFSAGRFFIFSGEGANNETIADLWQLVITKDCYRIRSCEDCVNVVGCGFCPRNAANYTCIPGGEFGPFIRNDCPLIGFFNDITSCPLDGFPGYIVALIIVGIILLIGGIWYGVVRWQRSDGYDKL